MGGESSNIGKRMAHGILREVDMYLHVPVSWKILGLLFFGVTIAIIALRSIGLMIGFIWNETMLAFKR